jgi:hypothetical protein
MMRQELERLRLLVDLVKRREMLKQSLVNVRNELE